MWRCLSPVRAFFLKVPAPILICPAHRYPDRLAHRFSSLCTIFRQSLHTLPDMGPVTRVSDSDGALEVVVVDAHGNLGHGLRQVLMGVNARTG